MRGAKKTLKAGSQESVIPCQQNKTLKARIDNFAEVLKARAHELEPGIAEIEFYNSGLFRGAIERVRGQISATMGPKREFVRDILNYMQDRGFIGEWKSSGSKNRHDYSIELPSGHIAAIELKGGLDGNNTTIFERPAHANEFIIWSVATNIGGNPRLNAWSGIHTRLGAEIISKAQQVDGVIIWDMMCGTIGRPCPKLAGEPSPRITEVSHFRLPPPCIYVLPATIPSPRTNPNPVPQQLEDVELLRAFANCFQVDEGEVNYVSFAVKHDGADTVRSTKIVRNGVIQKESDPTTILRS